MKLDFEIEHLKCYEEDKDKSHFFIVDDLNEGDGYVDLVCEKCKEVVRVRVNFS